MNKGKYGEREVEVRLCVASETSHRDRRRRLKYVCIYALTG